MLKKDLLTNPPTENLKIKELPKKGFFVSGLQKKIIYSLEDIFECLQFGVA